MKPVVPAHLLQTAVLAAVFATAAAANDLEPARIRCDGVGVLEAFRVAYRASATLRALVDAIESSDGIVYLENGRCRSGRLNSCLRLGPVRPGGRYLRITVDLRLPRATVAGLLAHELQHAIEVLSRADVVDDQSFARLFREIGIQCDAAGLGDCWETTRATAIEQLAAEEMRRYDSAARAAGRDTRPNGRGIPNQSLNRFREE